MKQKLKRKEIIINLQGLMVINGLTGREKEIIEAAIERLEKDRKRGKKRNEYRDF